ncbi:hypothetical protein OSB04_013996 [Centaurea solstitialis]|uniref:non-specific serine/threonine protein kinase n=1 Tax=Centaurea solstitialis TaxID=347529 RepID=A0AA38WFZ6_9ASTR|nr:hypothetical protein OSB04_013996 [Centaurea solstitialis]
MQRVSYLILFPLFLPFLVVSQQTNGSVPVGSSLTATDNTTEPWLSPSGDFAFGFQPVRDTDNFLLSIWYDKIPEKTIVWYPEGGPTVPRGSKVELTGERGLVLKDPRGVEVWTSGSGSDVAYGVMNDTGNFVIVRSNSNKIWESFSFPADTMLPSQVMERGGVIYSKRSGMNFSSGRFQLRLLQDGNLVLNARDIASNFAYAAYYETKTGDLANQSNSGDRVIFDATGYLYLLRRSGKRFDLTPSQELPLGDYYHRVTLDFDGVFTQYYHPKAFTNDSRWEIVWSYPENICLSFHGAEGSGACGFNSVCSLDQDNRPKCECPRGFSLLDPGDPYGDCKPYYFPNCDERELKLDAFEFVELTDIDWPTSDYVIMNPTSEQDCKNACLSDCFCAVAIYRGNKCWKKKLPLSNGKVDDSLNVKAFVKLRKGNLPPSTPPRFSGKSNDRQTLIIVGSALFGTSVLVNVILIAVICIGFFLLYHKKARNIDRNSNTIETTLTRFTYRQLVNATNGFHDELGKGAFGVVYKGVIGTKTVAVKKLYRTVEDGEKEFRTEVNAIARTHHKNLVQLLGYCDDGKERLLVYEYMSNGTLAGFLFGNMQPSWTHRCRIASGIAKGLAYLHEECSTQIIHCDIKPQNILLDEYYNARISDFGLAKLLSMNQSRTNTGIRGTKGYVAPEWFRNAPVTVKVDVYSFGVLLLEIVSCRKSVKEYESGGEYGLVILTDWAWDCYQERRLDLVVEDDSEALDDVKKVTTLVKVGLWCVQENPGLRPTMREVVQMLEGVVEVKEPPCPFPFSAIRIRSRYGLGTEPVPPATPPRVTGTAADWYGIGMNVDELNQESRRENFPMAVILPHLVFLTTFLRFVAAQQTNGSVSVGASITATPDVEPWLSPSGEFAFGFQQLQGNGDFLLCIWYDKIPDKTVAWHPKDGPTVVRRGSRVELTGGFGLVLSDPQGRQVWTSGSNSDTSYGFMNDTGNFVIVGTNSRNIWESFNSPSDTILPTQVMALDGVINSKMSKTNFSGGRFQLRMLADGNLVLNTRDVLSGNAYDAYYISGTRDASNLTNSGYQLTFDATGYLYILRRNGQRFDLTPRDRLPSGDYYHRATLDFNGVFTQYYYLKNPTGNTSWEILRSIPENICHAFRGSMGSGACGFNNVCGLESNGPRCECPQGFSLLDSSDPNGDCKPDFTPSCDKGEPNYAGDVFDFIEITDIDWPMSDYANMNPSEEQSCKNSCAEDCFCAVAIYRDNQCWKKRLPLSNGKVDTSLNVKAFLKSKKGEPIPGSGENRGSNRRSLILVGSVLLSTSVFVIVVLIGVISVGFFLIYQKKPVSPYPSSKGVETNLPRFTYQELVEATNGFKDELGKGAFGVVYKGVIGTTTVAVKKLTRVVEDGEKEFKTEVNTIAKTHHKNLLQILGYCDDGDQRLLVYEYVSNDTLAVFLFGEIKPSWKGRSYIGVGIAKGLAYLHEECSTQIIHCDIKPQNILLDYYYNAKISDFGLAKLLMMNQSRTNTGIRGTKGYVAPEWFRNTPVTVKVDVFSFGVLLLEIVSCRKSVVFENDHEDVDVLTDWAWDCYYQGRLDAFVENDSEALDDVKKVTTFVKVGLWCVQENPSLRPTMREVVQMLEGVVEVTEPPCPSPYSVTSV